MGKIYSRNDSPYIYADFSDAKGRRIQRSTRTTDPRVAKRRLRDMEMDTTSAARGKGSLANAVDYFIAVACAPKPAATRESYAQKAHHLKRLLGEIQLDDLEREHLDRYIAARLDEPARPSKPDKTSPHTVHKELVVLRGALDTARARKVWSGSLDVMPTFSPQYVPRETYLTQEQFVALIQHIVAPARNESEAELVMERRNRRALYCLLIAFASPRRGEVEALRWEHVDRVRGVIRIPKGKTVGRGVPIAPELLPWLEVMGDASGWRGPMVDPWTNVSRDLTSACARAGVPRVSCNDLRRTFSSWLVQRNVSLWVIAQLMGHGSVRMLETTYGRVDNATLQGAIGTLPTGIVPAINAPNEPNEATATDQAPRSA